MTKAYRTVSNDALYAIAGTMPIDQAILLHKDIKALKRGLPTIVPENKRMELPFKTTNINPSEDHICVHTSGKEGVAEVSIYTDGSKTQSHVGSGVVIEHNSKEIHIEAKRLHTNCTVFQAELYAIKMATDWITKQPQKHYSYSIHVDSQAALLAIANKNNTTNCSQYQNQNYSTKEDHQNHLPLGERTRGSQRKREGGLSSKNGG